HEVFAVKLRNGSDVTGNWPAQGVILEKIQTKEVVHIVVRSIFGLGNLLKNNRSFPLDLVAVKIRMKKNIGQQIDRQRQIFIKHFGVIAGVLFGSTGHEQTS